MLIIRTAEALAHALDSPLHPISRERLRLHAERLAEYDVPLEELALFAVVRSDDTLDDLEQQCALRLVADDYFAVTPELVEQEGPWVEVVFILSDNGFGLVLLVELAEATDPHLAAACRKHLGQ